MMIDLKPEAIQLLQEILPILDDAATQHEVCHEDEELIECWTPTDAEQQISCPDLNVGLLRKASRLKRLLRM